jgi:hypothetical protein
MRRWCILSFLVLLITASAFAQKTSPVTVVNTTSNPVPVTGTVSVNPVTVNSMPSVNISSLPPVTGTVEITGSVNVANKPDVHVVNSAANPLPVIMKRAHWQKLLMWAKDGSMSPTAIVVPEGKRIVVEYANVRVNLGTWVGPNGEVLLPDVFLAVRDYTADPIVYYTLALGPMGNVAMEKYRMFAASLPMKFVAQAGETVEIWENSTVNSAVWVFLSGYIEDLQ